MTRPRHSDHRLEIDRLVAEANHAAGGAAKVALMEEAIELADRHQDGELGYDTRMRLIDVAEHAGRPDIMIVQFSWCLSHADRTGRNDYDLLWRYKWVAQSSAGFPEISLEQLAGLLGDMKSRYERYGSSLHGYWQTRHYVAQDTDDTEALKTAYRKIRTIRRDSLSNCLACSTNQQSDHYRVLGQKKRCLQLAQPILLGYQRCTHVPQSTFANLLLPLLELGRGDEAMDLHHRNIRMLDTELHSFSHFGSHIEFLIVTDNLPEATQLFSRLTPKAFQVIKPENRFYFWRAARLLTLALADAGKKILRCRPPEETGLRSSGGVCKVADFASWLDVELNDLADRFTARNGNDGYRERLDELQRLATWRVPVPLR